jgi:GNAT superfamily N-acetyltransferase
MIALLDVTGGNPFEEHPQLQGIWPAEFQALAEEATRDTIGDDMARGDSGGIYLIVKEGRVIGITGYFYVETVDEPFLRWHGIVPAERGKGHSREALQLLIERIKAKIPHVKGLTELVPKTLTDYGVGLARHFEKLGFANHGALETYDWSPYYWQPVRLDIAALLQKR